jgi:hypothetical protein
MRVPWGPSMACHVVAERIPTTTRAAVDDDHARRGEAVPVAILAVSPSHRLDRMTRLAQPELVAGRGLTHRDSWVTE